MFIYIVTLTVYYNYNHIVIVNYMTGFYQNQPPLHYTALAQIFSLFKLC